MKHSYFADPRDFARKALNYKPVNASDYRNYSMHYYIMHLKQVKQAGLNHCLEPKLFRVHTSHTGAWIYRPKENTTLSLVQPHTDTSLVTTVS